MGYGKARNPDHMKNLRAPAPGEVRNPNGKPKRLINVIKKLPPNMQEEVFGILGYVLTLPDEAAAKKFLEYKEGELGQYGFVLQVAVKQLLKEGWGFGAMMDIMERLYGKPRQTAEVTHKADGLTIVVNNDDEKDKILNIKNLEV